MESLNAIIVKPIILPVTVNATMSSFILSLMDRNPYSRLGSQNGAEEIKNHSYFRSIRFSKLLSRQLCPPFIPELVFIIEFIIYIIGTPEIYLPIYPLQFSCIMILYRFKNGFYNSYRTHWGILTIYSCNTLYILPIDYYTISFRLATIL